MSALRAGRASVRQRCPTPCLVRGIGSKALAAAIAATSRIIRGVTMHELTGRTHWHEPTGGNRAGFGKFGRPKTPYDLFMESEGIPIFRDIGVSKVQNLPLDAVEADRRQGQLHPAARHRGQMGLLRRRGAGRRRAQSGEAPLRGNLSRRRGPRHDRSLARQRQQAPRVRMAEGLAVLDSRSTPGTASSTPARRRRCCSPAPRRRT